MSYLSTSFEPAVLQTTKMLGGYRYSELSQQINSTTDRQTVGQVDRPGRLEELDPDLMEDEEREDQS